MASSAQALAVASDAFLLAALSLTPKPWDKEANFATLERYARKAALDGAKLIVTPEGFLEGYVGNENQHPELTRERYFQIGEPVDGPVFKRIRNLARELNGVSVGRIR